MLFVLVLWGEGGGVSRPGCGVATVRPAVIRRTLASVKENPTRRNNQAPLIRNKYKKESGELKHQTINVYFFAMLFGKKN